jgi:hypothetical protein
MVRIEVQTVVDTLGKAVATFEDAHGRWQQAKASRDQVERRLEEMILRATGGRDLYRFEQALRRRSIHTTAEACNLAKVVRDQGAVQKALAQADRFRTLEEASIRAARCDLADASKQLLRYGQLALELTRLDERDVRHMARRPAPVRRSTP